MLTPQTLADWISAKIVGPAGEAVREKAASLGRSGKRIVTTNGVFDILHRGHLEYLARARALGDVLWVGVNSDASVKRLKGPNRPIRSIEDRLTQLAVIAFVDYVTEFDADDPREWLGQVRPKIHTKGGDYDVEKMIEAPIVREGGGTVVTLPFVEGESSTKIIERIEHVGK